MKCNFQGVCGPLQQWALEPQDGSPAQEPRTKLWKKDGHYHGHNITPTSNQRSVCSILLYECLCRRNWLQIRRPPRHRPSCAALYCPCPFRGRRSQPFCGGPKVWGICSAATGRRLYPPTLRPVGVAGLRRGGGWVAHLKLRLQLHMSKACTPHPDPWVLPYPAAF